MNLWRKNWSQEAEACSGSAVNFPCDSGSHKILLLQFSILSARI